MPSPLIKRTGRSQKIQIILRRLSSKKNNRPLSQNLTYPETPKRSSMKISLSPPRQTLPSLLIRLTKPAISPLITPSRLRCNFQLERNSQILYFPTLSSNRLLPSPLSDPQRHQALKPTNFFFKLT